MYHLGGGQGSEGVSSAALQGGSNDFWLGFGRGAGFRLPSVLQCQSRNKQGLEKRVPRLSCFVLAAFQQLVS